MRRRKTNNLDDLFDVAYNCLSDFPPSLLNVNMRDCGGRTLVHRAVQEGSTERLRAFLKAGCDINAVDNSGQVALLTVLKRADVCMVNELVQAGADVSVVHCNYDLLTWALNLYMAYFETSDQDNGPLIGTLNKCSDLISIMSLLLKAGADPDTRRGRMWTPLQYILKQTRTSRVFPQKIFQLLLEFGANPDSQLSSNIFTPVTPITIATDFVNLSAVRLLLQYNCSLNWFDPENHIKCTPVPAKPSVQKKDSMAFLKILNLLISFGCDLYPALSQLRALVSAWSLEETQGMDWSDLMTAVCNPMSLSVLCVSSVRGHLSGNLSKDVSHLNLPVSLQDYVAARNV